MRFWKDSPPSPAVWSMTPKSIPALITDTIITTTTTITNIMRVAVAVTTIMSIMKTAAAATTIMSIMKTAVAATTITSTTTNTVMEIPTEK